MSWRTCFSILLVVLVAIAARQAQAQSFGIELHNTMMPTSGGMAGVSIAKPQDVLSALGENPAALTQFRGTEFTFGGGWIETTYNISHQGGILPNLGPFRAKSEAEGSALGNIGVAHELDLMGRRAVLGVGLLGTAGAGLSFRDVPNANGTSVTMSILEIGSNLGVEVTDRFSIGASLMLGSSTLDAPFQGIGAAAYAYSLRGALGLTYDLGCCTTLGAFYHTPQNFNFDNAIQLQLTNGFAAVQDVNAGLPENIGLGIANEYLCDGQLLLAADVLYKHWDTAYLFGDIYDNQWVFQVGAQYELNPRMKFRLGYAYAENPIDPTAGSSAGGVIPPGPAARVQAAIEYLQATVAVINPHRVTAGVGIRDVLPGVDFDVFAGGMFRASQDFGAYTSTSLQGYWLGAGLTWEFGGAACDRLPKADDSSGCCK